MAYGSKNKTTKPGGRKNANNVGGSSLNQPGFGGGKERLKKGSLNQRGFGGGGDNYGCCKGFASKSIPKSEQ